MRRTKFNLSTPNSEIWKKAVKLTAAYLNGNVKANRLLDSLESKISAGERAMCQALFLGALRNGHRINAVLQPFIQRKLLSSAQAIVLVAGYELLSSSPEKTPKIVHHAVESSKQMVRKSQTKLLNALLRRLPEALNTVHPDNRPDHFFSHPRWLFKRWNSQFGLPATIELMRWNQQIPTIYLKFYQAPEVPPKGLEPTKWSNFYRVTTDASWQHDIAPLLNKGNVYVKDPSTHLAPQLLKPLSGEQVLDLCAAPGGKTYDLAHQMSLKGHLVAVDLPGDRTERLRENLTVLTHTELHCSILEADLAHIRGKDFVEKQLPTSYDAVMLDAPCSNTGVIQRRADVKWRLKPKT